MALAFAADQPEDFGDELVHAVAEADLIGAWSGHRNWHMAFSFIRAILLVIEEGNLGARNGDERDRSA